MNGPQTPAASASRYEDPSRAHTSAPASSPVASRPVVPPAPKPTKPLPADGACVTPACHAGFETASYIHGPVSAGSCSSCHQDDAGDHRFPLRRSPIKTCTFCHPIGETANARHVTFQDPGCPACHRPHVSETKFLLTAGSVESVCHQCHERHTGAYPHGPFAAGECTACHHPHESDTENLLRGGDGPRHCYTCHAETQHAVTNAPYQHQPAAEDCTTCHDAHASNFKNHLNTSVENACFRCHEDLEQYVRGAPAPHAAVFTADRCANCHDAHGSGRPYLLRERADRLCLHCHDKPIEASDGHVIADMRPELTANRYLHGPVESGDCAACHNAHGGTHLRLLREAFPNSFYTSFDLESYSLCFQCHNKDLVLSEETTSLTNFRDGNVNLHYLHVHREKKGRSCKSCHAIHGSNLPKHIAESVPFEGSQWSMPIRYVKTADGGTCAPGCHQELSYSRESRLNLTRSPASESGK